MTQMTQWPAGRAAVGLARMACACNRQRMTQMTQRHVAACWRPGARGHDPSDPKLSVSRKDFRPPGRALGLAGPGAEGLQKLFYFLQTGYTSSTPLRGCTACSSHYR